METAKRHALKYDDYEDGFTSSNNTLGSSVDLTSSKGSGSQKSSSKMSSKGSVKLSSTVDSKEVDQAVIPEELWMHLTTEARVKENMMNYAFVG